MSKRKTLVILLGVIPATGWGIYLLQAGPLWKPLWVIQCWVGVAALWIAALVPQRMRARAAWRWALGLGLSAGIFLAVFPIGFNVWGLFVYFRALPLGEILIRLGFLGLLIAPTLTAAWLLRSLFLPSDKRSS